MTYLLEARGLSKSFGPVVAVNDLNFTVESGEILGIAGPNGSGKSTLFNILTQIPFAASSGELYLDGCAIHDLSALEVIRRGIVRTFQREAVFSSMSCIDNILLAVEQTRGLRGKEALQAAYVASETTGFPSNFHNMAASALPVFYQKQLMITTAVAQLPKIVLMDEPASSLVDNEIDWMRQVILRLNKSGVTILLIEHVLPLLTSVSTRLLVMESGTIIAEGLPADVIRESVVIEAYLGGAGI